MSEADPPRARAARVTAAGAALAAVMLAAGTVVLHVLLAGRSPDPADGGLAWLARPLSALGLALPGAYLALRRPRQPVGWVMTVGGAVQALTGFSYLYALLAYDVRDGDLPVARWALWFGDRAGAVGDLTLPLLLLLLPHGRLPAGRARWVGRIALAAVAVLVAVSTFWGGDVVPRADTAVSPALYGVPNPTGLFGDADRDWNLLLAVTGACLLITVLLSGGVAVARFVRSRGEARLQMLWIATFAALLVAGVLVGPLLPTPAEAAVTAVTGWAFSGAVLVAVLRHQLWRIEPVLDRALVYAGTTAALLSLYLVVTLAAQRLVRGGGVASLLAAAAVAVAFAPLRTRLQAAVNRWLYGDRDDPWTAVRRLGDRVAAALPGNGAIDAVADTVGIALRSPGVVLRDADGAVLASSGRAPAEGGVRRDLLHAGLEVGRLEVASRGDGRAWSPSELALLDGLAAHAAAAVHAAVLGAQLQRSRERLVDAREEERRRLRRDLHDGVGAALAAVGMRVAVARRLVPRDPERAERLLGEVRQEIHELVEEVRRVSHAMRPPAVDDLGLAEALRRLAAGGEERAEEGSGGDGEGPEVDVRIGPLPALPAAHEVALYRIVAEALANVRRHAAARHATVELRVDGPGLLLVVADDGVGLPPVRRAGVGTVSIRERAEELGGAATTARGPHGGTVVTARLPLPGTALADAGELRTEMETA